MYVLVDISILDWFTGPAMPFFIGYKTFGEALEVLALAAIALIAADLMLRGLLLMFTNRDSDPHKAVPGQAENRLQAVAATSPGAMLARLRQLDRDSAGGMSPRLRGGSQHQSAHVAREALPVHES